MTGPEDYRRPVVQRVVKGRPGQDQAVDEGDGDADRVPASQMLRQSTGRRPVQEEPAVNPCVKGRDHHRAIRRAQADLADRRGVQNGIEGLRVIRPKIIAGTATPANSPVGSGRRRIPDRTCIDRHFLVPAGSMCGEPTQNGSVVVAFDDPRSPFNGVRRKVDINSNRVNNLDGPNVWYPDPFGKNGSATAFPGSVRQWIARVNNDRAFDFSGPTIGGERSYGASGTHAPN